LVTVRRLILELGIEGDLSAKNRLNSFQNVIDDLKKSLIGLERELETVGRSMGGIPLISGVGTSPILTQKEREASDRTTKAIQDSAQEAKNREEKQLHLTEESIKLQEKLLITLQDQQTSFKEAIEMSLSTLERTRMTPKTQPRDPATGRFIRAGGRSETTERLTQKLTEIQPLDPFTKALEEMKKDPILIGGKTATEILRKDPSKTIMTTEKALENLGGKLTEEEKLKLKLENINKMLKEVGLEEGITEEAINIKPYIPTSEDVSIESISKEITRLRESGERIENLPSKSEEFLERTRRIQRLKRRIQRRREGREIYKPSEMATEVLEEAGYDPMRLKSGEEVREEFERRSIEKRMQEMRAEVEENLSRQEEIKERGFAVPIVEKMRDWAKDVQKRYEGFKERSKRWLIEKVSRTGLIKPAEEFLKEKEAGLEEKAGEIAEAQKKMIKNEYNIVINNPKVDSDERADKLIGQITTALRGL